MTHLREVLAPAVYPGCATEHCFQRKRRQPMAMFTINLFGAIQIYHGSELLTDFRSQKALVLLAYLICEDRPLTREYLAGLA